MGWITDLLKRERIRKYIERLGGEYGPRVLEIMDNAGGSVTDEYVAEFLGVKVTVVRTVFNRFHFWGLVDYKKERDPDTGWYTFRWYVRPGRIRDTIMKEVEEDEKEIIKKMDELNSYMFFECPKGHERVVFEVAAELNFTCPVCGAVLKPIDTEKEMEELRKELNDIANIKAILRSI